MQWSPGQYSKFSGPRLQPGLDLLVRLPDLPAKHIVDLGCGTGELTELLATRYPEAKTVGVDSSESMLAKARAAARLVTFERGDIATWSPREPVDVLFSNAAYHWVPEHRVVIPRLLGAVRPGGVFAAQMPRNFAAPSHALMREVASSPRFAGRVKLEEEPTLSAASYYDVLAPLSRSVEIWETEYLHVLEGEDPVLEWVRGTALLPVTQALSGDELEAFIDDYRRKLRAAYPTRADGRSLFPFRRIFLLAVV